MYRWGSVHIDRNGRLALFLAELEQTSAAFDLDSARALLAELLNRIEDAHSDAPNDPRNWRTDGRIYPPEDDFERASARPGTRLFYSKGHSLWFAANGAIRIEVRGGTDSGRVLLDKPGADGALCP